MRERNVSNHEPIDDKKNSMSGGVLLRDVVDGDLPIFIEQQLDPEATQMADFPARNEDAFFKHWTKILTDENNTLKTILFEGQVAGNIVSWEQSGQRQVGYWIGRELWGRSIATRALSEFLGIVKIRPLYAHVAKNNAASIRVLEKNGFTLIGEDKFFSSAQGEEVEELLLKLS
jgi:RimJ/RimL family protein N-acetyltransferase